MKYLVSYPDGFCENKKYPLVELKMTEKDCLDYCRECGFDWVEGDVNLYDILDRVSCWCCANKNLKELRNYKRYLPKYWLTIVLIHCRLICFLK